MNIQGAPTYAYFLINGLIGVTFLSFMASVWVARQSKMPIKSLHLLRISQFLILSSIAVGILSPHFPTSIFPSFKTWVTSQIRPASLGLAGNDQDFDESLSHQKRSLNHESMILDSSKEEDQVTHSYQLSLSNILETCLFLGFVFFFGRTLFRIYSLYQIVSRSTVLRRSGQTIILVSDQTRIPFSTRILFKAHVVLPVQILSSQKALKFAVQHELQHHRSGDTLWIVLMEFFSIIFFWNPALYLWRIKIEELQEFACDEALVLRNKVSIQDYGNCLIQVAQNWIANQKSFVGAAGMASAFANPNKTRSLLKRRVEMLFTYQKTKASLKKAMILGGVSTASLLILSAIIGGKTEAKVALQKVEVEPSIQRIANQALADGVKKAKAEDGFAIVADPMTGTILALSYYDGNTQQSIEASKAADLILSKIYAPQSLVKPVIIASALDRNKITPSEKFNCEEGSYRVAGKEYHDHSSFGDLTTTDIVAHSSDIGTIKICEKIGKEGIVQAVKDFGFGDENISSSLPGLARGHAPTIIENQSVAQFLTDFYIGKNTYSSPIELVQAYGAIANGGRLLKPQSFQKNSSPSVIRQVITPATSEIMKKILAEVVLKGTGQKASLASYSTAGKTGTAGAFTQTPQGPVYNQDLGAAHFIGLAPIHTPKIVAYVVIEKSEIPAHGGSLAAPVFAQITEKTLQYLDVKPDRK